MISDRNASSNSEYLCHCDASHQVLALSDTVWEKMSLKNFTMAATGGHSWILERNASSNSESLCHCDASHQDLTYGLGGDVV